MIQSQLLWRCGCLCGEEDMIASTCDCQWKTRGSLRPGIPARIDLGKNKYEGPFTNEEVEDVKTFFHMLVLLLSLFSNHLIGDTFSLIEQLELQQGCPSIPSLVLALDPFAIPTALVVVLLPLYQTAVVQRALVFLKLNMIGRIWIGLLYSILQVFCEYGCFDKGCMGDWRCVWSVNNYNKRAISMLLT